MHPAFKQVIIAYISPLDTAFIRGVFPPLVRASFSMPFWANKTAICLALPLLAAKCKAVRPFMSALLISYSLVRIEDMVEELSDSDAATMRAVMLFLIRRSIGNSGS